MVPFPEKEVSKLSLGYLASYEGMGWAQVECLGACSCTRTKIDANSTSRASQEHFATIGVERQNDGVTCLLKVANLYQSSSVDEGHKFKVSSVAWSGEQKGSGSSTKSSQHAISGVSNSEVPDLPDPDHAVVKPNLDSLIGSI